MPDKQLKKNEPPRYAGDVNSSLLENTFIRGWAWDRLEPEISLNLELYIDGKDVC